jgi:hypothetical protein
MTDHGIGQYLDGRFQEKNQRAHTMYRYNGCDPNIGKVYPKSAKAGSNHNSISAYHPKRRNGRSLEW